jgi:hypothetical protein
MRLDIIQVMNAFSTEVRIKKSNQIRDLDYTYTNAKGCIVLGTEEE